MDRTDWIGKKVRIILTGDRFYNGEVLEEDDVCFTIKDKFCHTVMVGKASIVSMEALNE